MNISESIKNKIQQLGLKEKEDLTNAIGKLPNISESIKNKIQQLGLEGNQIKEDLTNAIGKLPSEQDPPIGCRNKPRLDEGGLITVRVELGQLTAVQPLKLHGFKADDTISDLKAKILQIAKSISWWRPFNLDKGPMESEHRRFLEDNETLGSLFYPGCRDCITTLFYDPDEYEKIEEEPKEKKEMDWLSVCKHVRERVEAQVRFPLPYTQPYYIGFSKRAKHIRQDLGLIQGYNLNTYKDIFSVDYAPNVCCVILASDYDIYEDLVKLNSESKYIVIRVCWDMTSYLTLRLIRTLYPVITFVAVTNLDPHHLDLLTFLDTPSKELHNCYGCYIDLDYWVKRMRKVCPLPRLSANVIDIDFLNIKWLGMRPTDCENHLFFDGDAGSYDFGTVIRMLKVNPFLRRKKAWLEALDWLQVFGKCVSLLPLPTTCPSYCYVHLGDDFIATKLSKKDWV